MALYMYVMERQDDVRGTDCLSTHIIHRHSKCEGHDNTTYEIQVDLTAPNWLLNVLFRWGGGRVQ